MKKILITFFLLLVVTFQAHAATVPDFLLRTLDGVETFEGDRHNQFAGDFVAVLNDDSRWKVHPGDKAKFRKWNFGDEVHVRLRTSHYWFKREHKFDLYNHTLKDSVRVMLVNYPDQALFVQAFQDVEVDRELKTRPAKDKYGQPLKDSKGDPILEQYWECIYHRDLLLSDGTVWRIKSVYDAFAEGKFVYVGMNSESDGLFYFLIAGSEREAVWTRAARIF